MALTNINIVYVVLLVFIADSCGLRVKRGICSFVRLDIRNGDYSVRAGNSIVEYTCNRGFILYGSERLVCFGTKWSSDKPSCIANTCSKIDETDTLRIEKTFEGAVLKFSCSVQHRLVGSENLVCDGSHWNDNTPTCEVWDPPTSCDFENGMCGWFQHEKDEQDWVLNTGGTRTTRTGPEHDHTLGQDGEGHYMYFETSSPARPGHNAIFESPLYPADLSSKCFNFWYHILGEKDIGSLEVFFKPDGHDGLTGLIPAFHVQDCMGVDWLEKTLPIPRQTGPFQIWIVATRAMSYRSDFAIDDVKLQSCTGVTTVVTAGTNPTTTKATTRIFTTQKLITQAPTTTEATTLAPTTTKATTQAPTTTKATTQAPTTTKATTQAPTTTKATTQKTITTKTTTKTHMKTESSAPKTKIVTTRQLSQTTKKAKTTPITVKPLINPNHPKTKQSAIKSEESNAGKIAYILLGIGLVAAIAIGVMIGLFLYRRRSRRRSEVSLSSTNPLYHEIENDETVVKFANVNPYENY